MRIRAANKGDLATIIQLLDMANLPTKDCAETIDFFIVAEEEKRIVAVGGLEVHDTDGLLRSVAVVPDQRNSGVGRAICSALEIKAAQAGVERLFLLTETAVPYFLGLGFDLLQREHTPPGIQATKQFSDLCPITAHVMSRGVKPVSGRKKS